MKKKTRTEARPIDRRCEPQRDLVGFHTEGGKDRVAIWARRESALIARRLWTQKADGLLSMLEDASKSDDVRQFKRKKRKKLVKSTNNMVGTAIGELSAVANKSKPVETFEPEELDSKQFRKSFEVRVPSPMRWVLKVRSEPCVISVERA